MQITRHANKRCQQRALPHEVLDLLILFGNDFDSGGGTRIRALASKFSKIEFLQELRVRGIEVKEKWCDAYLVMSPYGSVITAGYRYKKLHRKIH